MSAYNDALAFGRLKAYEYNGIGFFPMDSLAFKPVLIPKDVADTDGDGLLELLVSVNDSMFSVEQAASGLFPQVTAFESLGEGYYPARFGNVDADPELELLAKDLVDYRVFESDGGGGFTPGASLADQSGNYIGSVAPKVLVEDFDGDGQEEVVFGDFDGDILVYEYDGSSHQLVFLDTTNFTQSGSYLVAGDFDGDGDSEFCVAVHPSSNRNELDFEYNAPYWKIRVFDAVADNQFEVVDSIYVYDLDTDNFNALTAGNVDADPADELIFSTFPRTYILEMDAGSWQATWFHFGDLTTHHWVADVNGNGVNEVAIGRGDKALFWEKDLSYNGPQPVVDLRGFVPGSGAVQLAWTASSNAPEYRIWRGEFNGGSVFINAIDSTGATEFLDTSLVRGQAYLYVLESKNTGLNPVYSSFSNAVVLTPDSLGRLDSVVAVGPRQLKCWFSVPVAGDDEDLPLFWLNNQSQPATLIASGDFNRSLVLGFSEDFLPSNVLVLDTHFLDLNRRRLEPASLQKSFDWKADTSDQAHFTRCEVLNPKEARIWFNYPMDASVLDLNRYQMYPSGQLVAVRFSDATQQSIVVEVGEVALGALGYPVSIELNGGAALNGAPMRTDAGNVATFSELQDDLSGVYVYPKPYEGNDFFPGIRFANLSRNCTVTVYTASGRKVIGLEENDGDGGLEWDLLNAAGERVAPGNYIFRVESEGLEPFIGTFSLLR